MAATNAIFGINSNLDTEDIINKMVSLEARTMDLVEAKKQIEEQKLSSFQELKNRLQTFKTIVSTLNTESRFIVNQGAFSNNNANDGNRVVGITTTSSATSGTFSLIVKNLALESKIISEGFSSTSSELKKGTINITVAGVSTKITLDDTNNSLDGLRLAINNLGLDVKAAFLNDGSADNPIRLLISGTKTGADNAVTIDSSVSGIGVGAITQTAFRTTQTAQNANLVLDGIAITKSSNTVSDIITGVALRLESAGSGAINLSTDTSAVIDKVTEFVDEFNELMLYLNGQLALDSDTGDTGVLFGNFAVQSLQQSLRNSVSSQVIGISGDFKFLSQIGITTEPDGTLIVNTDKFKDALTADLENVSQLFASRGSTTNSGVTFIGFTRDTQAGTYDVRISDGTTQLSSNSGASTFVNATGTGNFFAGASGKPEGLNFRLSDLSDGDYGQITLSLGVAEILNRQLANLLDTSLNGPIATEVDTITESIDDFNITLLQQAERLLIFEQELKERFTHLEVTLGRLNSQKNVFEASLAGIQQVFSFRRK